MLIEININNFTIINDLSLSLAKGMTVITGETGVGKSIIIDAVELALGKRISGNVVQEGSERADICLTFDAQTIPDAIDYLKKCELDCENECVVRRIVYKDGRSKSYVNGIPVTLQCLRELSETLVNIHGQHEFQTLLKPKIRLFFS